MLLRYVSRGIARVVWRWVERRSRTRNADGNHICPVCCKEHEQLPGDLLCKCIISIVVTVHA